MRHWSSREDGYNVITWRWWIIGSDGHNISGSIYYPDTQAKIYDPVIKSIVNSIRFVD